VRRGRLPFGDHELAYTVFGEGPRVTVLIHGLLLSQRMQWPLARALAARGNRVITIDLLGHGESSQPDTMWKYSMTHFGQQVIALLDHLGIDEAIVAGTSLGANTTLEVASLAPERLRGMVVEMPVLDNALLACALAFTPPLIATTIGAPLTRVFSRALRLVPRSRLPLLLDVGVEVLQRDPGPSAAVLQGLFFGRVAPHRDEPRTFTAPTLVLGHRRDPVHPFSDAGMLVDELPNGRLLEADSIIELRLAPERLTEEIAAFVEECWRPRAADKPRRRRANG
jgi:pimeloyl-ACP methyl ester carboxylesterase